jgi:hypothetical protein
LWLGCMLFMAIPVDQARFVRAGSSS